ncbi:MAG: LysM peptidoglycan-binding domain-containing protein [Planctomycetota bacterium]|nr:LysM peptidoglycan-binding domain-containing protein [Planctomycetota bacterium]
MAQASGSDDSLFGNARADSTGSVISTKRSPASAAGRVFREFKWGLLTLFLLMVVVAALVYEGGRRRAANVAGADPGTAAESEIEGSETQPAASGMGEPERSSLARDSASAAQPDLPPDWDAPPSLNGKEASRPAQPASPGAPAAPARAQVPTPATVAPAHRQPASAAAAAAASGSDAGRPVENYTVTPGDSLTKIARQFYGAEKAQRGIEAILAANAPVVKNANLIHPGMTLKIPPLPDGGSAADTARPGSTPAADNSGRKGSIPASQSHATDREGRIVYIVQSGDCLESIAEKLLKDRRRWREIAEANNISGSRIRAGQKLLVAVAPSSQTQPKTSP